MSRVEVLQGGCDLENPPASKCPVADRSDHVRVSICDGLGLDAEWEHQRICEGKPRCEPVETGRLPSTLLAPSLLAIEQLV